MQLVLVVNLLFLVSIKTFPDIRHTWPPWAEPGPCEDGLEFDGSLVPDCRLYISPETPGPFFLEHSISKKDILSSKKERL